MTYETASPRFRPTVVLGCGARRRCRGRHGRAACTGPAPGHGASRDISRAGPVTGHCPRAEARPVARARYRCSSRGLRGRPTSRGERAGLGHRAGADGWPHVDAIQIHDGLYRRAGVGDLGAVWFVRGTHVSKSGQGPVNTTHNYTVQRTGTAPLYSASRPVGGCAVPSADGERSAD